MLTIEINDETQKIAETISELGWKISEYNVVTCTPEELEKAAELVRKRRLLVEALGSIMASKINELPF